MIPPDTDLADMKIPESSTFTSRQLLFAGITLACILLLLFLFLSLNFGVSEAAIKQIQPGTPQEQVIRLIGDPARLNGRLWIYPRDYQGRGSFFGLRIWRVQFTANKTVLRIDAD